MILTKAEVLLTRRCNLRCQNCGVIKERRSEMSLEQWCEAFDIIYDLGATFIALYGGEPLEVSKKKLLGIVQHLAGKRRPGRDFTIISNGVKLTDSYADELIQAGLQSWTSSVDAISPKNKELGNQCMTVKTQAGIAALKLMKSKGVRDTCGIITVTAKNLDRVVETVEWLSANGHWAGIDVIHYQRGDDKFNFSAPPEEMADLVLRDEHRPKLKEISDFLIVNHKRLLVFPTPKVLAMWPKEGVDLNWRCAPASITVDSDGTLGLCDDRFTGHTRAFNILKLKDPDELAAFEFVYRRGIKSCPGCFWSTHVMAVDALNDPKLRAHYVHQINPGDL